MDDAKLATLVSMGFDVKSAESALSATNGDVERAIERIVSGGGSSGDGGFAGPDPEVPSEGRLVRAIDGSQYTVPDGRSACTCIALSAADRFLRDADGTAAASADSVVDSIVTDGFLSEVLTSGVQIYGKVKAGGGGGGGVEHTSAEEIMKNPQGRDSYPSLSPIGGVRQGVLSSDPSGPLGLRSVLQGCRSDEEIKPDKWTAVIITKSPETVAVLLPPTSYSEGGFLLVDSHPRPQLSTGGSYAMVHGSLDGLVRTLKIIFPAVDLGPDVGEMMAMMYNSFDANVVQRK